MSITKEKKSKLIDEFKMNEKDTGSAYVQVAILSEKIKSLTLFLGIIICYFLFFVVKNQRSRVEKTLCL